MWSKQKLLKRFYIKIIVFRLFQKNLPPAKDFENDVETKDETTDFFSRIRCPLCKWQPKRSSRWFCADAGFPEYFSGGCGTAWNTFATRGVCPGCRHQWKWTTCLSCGEWSLHDDWYGEKTGD